MGAGGAYVDCYDACPWDAGRGFPVCPELCLVLLMRTMQVAVEQSVFFLLCFQQKVGCRRARLGLWIWMKDHRS